MIITERISVSLFGNPKLGLVVLKNMIQMSKIKDTIGIHLVEKCHIVLSNLPKLRRLCKKRIFFFWFFTSSLSVLALILMKTLGFPSTLNHLLTLKAYHSLFCISHTRILLQNLEEKKVIVLYLHRELFG